MRFISYCRSLKQAISQLQKETFLINVSRKRRKKTERFSIQITVTCKILCTVKQLFCYPHDANTQRKNFNCTKKILLLILSKRLKVMQAFGSFCYYSLLAFGFEEHFTRVCN